MAIVTESGVFQLQMSQLADTLRYAFLGEEKTAAAAEVVFLGDGRECYNVALVERRGGQLCLTKEAFELSSWQDLVNFLPRNSPVAILLSGKGLLEKDIVNAGNYAREKMASAILPAASPSDFYWELEADHLVIIRKDLVNAAISHFTQYGYPVVATHLGAVILSRFLPLFSDALKGTRRVTLSSYALDVKEGQVAGYELLEQAEGSEKTARNAAKQTLRLGEDARPMQGCLPAFAAASLLLINGINEENALPIETVAAAREENRYSGKLRQLVSIAAAVIIPLLILSIFLAQYYADKSKAMTAKINGIRALNDSLEVMNRNNEKKEALMTSLGWARPVHFSVASDRLAAGLPDSIRLALLSIVPVSEKTLGDKTVLHFKKDSVVIAGECSGPTQLGAWLDELRDEKTFKHLAMTRFTFDPKTKKSMFLIEASF